MNALWLVVQVTSMGPGKLIIDISVMSLASLSPSILCSHQLLGETFPMTVMLCESVVEYH